MASKNTDKPLPKRLQPALKALEKDRLERAKIPSVEAGLRAAWEAGARRLPALVRPTDAALPRAVPGHARRSRGR